MLIYRQLVHPSENFTNTTAKLVFGKIVFILYYHLREWRVMRFLTLYTEYTSKQLFVVEITRA